MPADYNSVMACVGLVLGSHFGAVGRTIHFEYSGGDGQVEVLFPTIEQFFLTSNAQEAWLYVFSIIYSGAAITGFYFAGEMLIISDHVQSYKNRLT